MKDFYKNSRLILVLFHLALGFVLQNSILSKFYGVIIILFAALDIIRTKNDKEQAVLWCAYIAGSDVLFRMSGGSILYEMNKYAIAIFLILALFIEKRKSNINPTFMFYMLLLCIGIAFSDIPYPESIRKAVLFNLSGPLSLGFAALYFYKREFSLQKVLDILFCMALPIITVASFLFFKTPSVFNIRFGGGANFAASGGYGPNQVSTILGLGGFALTAHFLLKKKYSSILILDGALIGYILFRNLLTFSRGGLLTSVIAIVFFGTILSLAKKNSISSILKSFGIITIVFISLFIITSITTNGQIENRFTNKNAAGVEKKDITTGRSKLFESDIDGIYENPIFGMGVGSGKYKRIEEDGVYAASHNEMSRLIGEHGLIGVIILLMLIIIPIVNALDQPLYAQAFLGAFFIFWFLTINHSAMRISFPSFIYALSLIKIRLYEKDIIYR